MYSTQIKSVGQCCSSKDAGVEVLTDVMHLSPMSSVCVCVCVCVCVHVCVVNSLL
jgi:hypothetical protein